MKHPLRLSWLFIQLLLALFLLQTHGAIADPSVRSVLAQADTATETESQARKLHSILGKEVRTPDGDMGRIIDVLTDRNGLVQAAVVELGGFLGIGTRKIVVEWSTLRFESAGKPTNVVLDMNRDQLRRAPLY